MTQGRNQNHRHLLAESDSHSGSEVGESEGEAGAIRDLLESGTHFLRFPEPFESKFREFYAMHYLSFRRKAILAGGCVALVMGLMDYSFMQPVWWEIVAIRWGGGGILLGLVVMFSWSRFFERHQQTTIIAFVTIVSLVLTAMMAIAPEEVIAFYFPGMVLIVVFCTALVRLDFWNAVMSVLAIWMVFNLLILWGRPQAPNIILAYNLFFVGASIMGLLVNYYSEHGTRTDFLKGGLLKITQAKLRDANHRLRELASLDGLTGVANRLCFDDVLKREWLRAKRSRSKISLLMLDIDFFKSFNDNYGHQAGDICLVQVAEVLRECCRRPSDVVARYGGEEFAVVLPDTDGEDAKDIAVAICRKIGSLGVEHGRSEVASVVTASIGVGTLLPGDNVEPFLLVNLADKALYEAKKTGRNRVVASV